MTQKKNEFFETTATQSKMTDVVNRCNIARRSCVAGSTWNLTPTAAGFAGKIKSKRPSKEDCSLLGALSKSKKGAIQAGANCVNRIAGGIKKLSKILGD